MGEALRKLSEEDPTFRVHTDESTGQTIISGMGELHLEVLVDRMLREFRVQANVGRPRVAYRETITRDRREGQLQVCQADRRSWSVWSCGHRDGTWRTGNGVVFENKIVGGAIPREYIPAVEKGVREAAEGGVLAGYPVTDVKVTSVSMVRTTKSIRTKWPSKWLPPGLQRRRSERRSGSAGADHESGSHCPGRIPGRYYWQIERPPGDNSGHGNAPGNAQAVNAMVPLAEMFGYATELRSATQGRGVFTMEFDHYAPVPEAVAQKVYQTAVIVLCFI